MENKYEFFIAGRTRNKENILKICDLFDKYKISYYCFLKNEDNWGYGNENQTPEENFKNTKNNTATFFKQHDNDDDFSFIKTAIIKNLSATSHRKTKYSSFINKIEKITTFDDLKQELERLAETNNNKYETISLNG